MYWHDGMGGAGWLLVAIGVLLLLGVVIATIVLLVRWALGQSRSPATPQPSLPDAAAPRVAPQSPDAEQILAERFARGEIDEDEYRRRRDTLRGG